MDYGHDLLFGVFITPTNDPAVDPIGLSVLAEQAGLDLATYQDHPYQPSFYDTWTLMSYAAARTDRIRLSANVLNLPLRPPAGDRTQRCQPGPAHGRAHRTRPSALGRSGRPSRRQEGDD